jgi:hypothetical protein
VIPELSITCDKDVVGMELLLNPDKFKELEVQVQVKSAPATFEVNVTEVLSFLQISFVRGVLVNKGTGWIFNW